MSKRFPLFMALGAGLAFVTLWNQFRREEKSQQWDETITNHGQGTALITGASSGIGAAFARALARQGYNLVLLARREERLKALAEEIKTFNPVQVEPFVADLSDPADLERAANHISQIPDLTMLINNAGFGTGGWFVESSIAPEMKMIQVHVAASQRLMHAALQVMVPRKHGAVINVSSMAALMSLPGNATYGATKSYLNFFTKSVNSELAGSGVRLQALCPGFTHSDFHAVAGIDMSILPSFLWLTAEQVVAESLQALREDRVVVIPGRIYQAMALAMRIPGIEPVARFVQKQRFVQLEKRAAELNAQQEAPGL